jgi:hypothetical protein
MRTAMLLPVLALCSACSVVPPEAWTFDPRTPPAKVTLPPEELAAMTNRLAELQTQRNEVRTQIAAERDVWQRQEDYRRLHDIVKELAPLERRLANVAYAR